MLSSMPQNFVMHSFKMAMPDGPRDVMMQNDQDKARLMRELKTLADGKDLTEGVGAYQEP